MRRTVLLAVPLVLATMLVGVSCLRTSDPPPVSRASEAQPFPAPSALVPIRSVGAFALPDRGDLLRYSAQPVRHENASTWYPADISEAHAFSAIVTGHMTITAPDGQPVRLRYQRHFEHPNGNWTWIGRDAYGEDAVLTFGEKAVFGSIPQHGREELRLSTRGGRAWVVQIDPARLHSPEASKPDFLIPPSLAASLASSESIAASAQPQAAAATAAVTVDVALGYTTAYAAELGGDSQAVTRLQNLVDITNQAYANSQINAQVRLVRTLSVAYADATDNSDALSKLSGYKAGTGTIPTDPAFAGLRAARNEYGADLVSLVRRFRTPENDGCGIAWLIGGNKSPIDNSDAPFGYSVVSDDLDMGDYDESDGKTYGCRKESLAHEFGHNMGQAHNTEDSTEPGAHAYSYGYREASTSGFYTVMAYRLPNSAQRGIHYFANPNVVDAATGRPTGVANASDNARSMAITMPIIANFRPTVLVLPPPQPSRGLAGDIDGDNKDDVLWFNPQTGELYYWLMDGGRLRLGRGGAYAPLNATPRAMGDVNNDGRADILLASGQDLWIYLGNASGSFVSAYLAPYPAGWDFVGLADVDADGKADAVWHNPTTRELYYWLLDGATIRLRRGGVTTPAGTAPRLGDLNGDHRTDVILPGSGDIWVYIGNSAGYFTSAYIASYPAGWNMVGVQDVDADGKDDLLWHHPNSGELYYWLMNGGAIRLGRGGVLAPTGTTPRIVADFNSDGRADLFLPNSNNIWTYVGNTSGTFTSFYTAPYPAGWY